MPLASSRSQPWQPNSQEQSSDLQGEPNQQRVRGWQETPPLQRPYRGEEFSGQRNQNQFDDSHKFNRLDNRQSTPGISTTTRYTAESQIPLDERQHFDGEYHAHPNHEFLSTLRDFASQKWDQLAHGDHHRPSKDDNRAYERRDERLDQPQFTQQSQNRWQPQQQPKQQQQLQHPQFERFERDSDLSDQKFESFKLNDNRWRRTAPRESPFGFRREEDQKGLWGRVKETGREWKEDAKEWKDEHLHARRDARDTRRTFDDQRGLNDQRAFAGLQSPDRRAGERWSGDDPLEAFEHDPLRASTMAFNNTESRQRGEDATRRTLRNDDAIPLTLRDDRQTLQRDVPRQNIRDDSMTVQREDDKKHLGLWGRITGKAEEKQEDTNKVDELVRGAPYQRASSQGMWDSWWHRQEQYGQEWERMKESGHMFKEPEFKLHPMVALPERIDPTTERASSTEEALSDHTDPFVEDGLIGLHEVEAADVLENEAHSGARKFIASKWHALTNEKRFDTRDNERREREWSRQTFGRRPESQQTWPRLDESGRFGSPTLKGQDTLNTFGTTSDFMSDEEFQAWDRYRVRLADAFNDRSGSQIESNQ